MEFRILGPLEVVDDGRPVPLERRLSRALLAYLLLHANEPVSSDRLVDELWGERPPKTAVASLQNTVSRLRKTIGAERLRLEPAGYVLRVDPETLDVAQFERLVAEAKTAPAETRVELLRAALGLWRGTPLEDLTYEPFADSEVAALSERFLKALEERIDAELELGAGPELVTELEELAHAHPLRERFRAQLMLALYRAGRQADALGTFAAARETLREELGLEPGEELRALQRRILEQDASLGTSDDSRPSRDSRRTVTVLFCDVVDSTRLATTLDPEAYRALMSAYFAAVRAAVELHGGTVEKFIGDAVMALFGVPDLHEDDAVRAVRAAVDAREAVARLNETAAREWEVELAVRIAVNTGEVVVGMGEAAATGAAVNVAAHLEKHAGRNEIVLGADTERLVRAAVRTEKVDLGDGLAAWRLDAVVAAETPVARRLDAPLVGRNSELRRLRAAFRRAEKEQACVVATVVGEAGIGKTRLARELVASLGDDARVVVGRCVAYGAGATYLPITEIVRAAAPEPSAGGVRSLLEGEDDADQVAQRVAELVGFAGGPAAPGETFWAVRRLFESLARERPLLVALDDIHWAEPTLLDLVEYLGEWVSAPVFVLCLARRELLEARPTWGGPTSSGFVVELEPLAADEVGVLVETLADGPVAPDLHGKIVEHAGGNPLFAEQLLALASEAPDVSLEHAPPTVEALIASRLDRLPPSELDVLQRASVVGRRFGADELDVSGLAALERRGLVHRTGDGYRFHHVLVRDVAYRSIPKARRAELHEQAARRGGPDEIVGFHYEQAFQYRTELARADEQARQLAQLAGEHLGAAGIRSWKRADAPAAHDLLGRSVALLDVAEPLRRTLLCELGLVTRQRGDAVAAEALFAEAADVAAAHGDAPAVLRARVESAALRMYQEPGDLDQVLAFARGAISELEKVGDNRALGRAWLLVGAVRGQFQCLNDEWLEAAERAAVHYQAAGFSPAWCVGDIALALYYGSTPVRTAIERCAALLRQYEGDRAVEASVLRIEGCLRAQRGEFDEARALVVEAIQRWEELGQAAAAESALFFLGDVEIARDAYAAAEEPLRRACDAALRRGERAVAASHASLLADVLYAQGRPDEASEWAATARTQAEPFDIHAAAMWRSIAAKLDAAAGANERADELSREAVQLLSASDALNDRGRVLLDRAEVLQLAGRHEEAVDAARAAEDVFARKENAVGRARAANVLREVVSV